jgi:hypothetical protein
MKLNFKCIAFLLTRLYYIIYDFIAVFKEQALQKKLNYSPTVGHLQFVNCLCIILTRDVSVYNSEMCLHLHLSFYDTLVLANHEICLLDT